MATATGAQNEQKIVVFDLDETLGHFVQLGIFWDAVLYYVKPTAQKQHKHFFDVLDIMPEFLRPSILDIIKFLLKERQQKHIHKIMIYTNNQGPRSWVEMISAYFTHKLGTPVFDQIIAAFKVGGRVVEPKRTTHDKTVQDLINCTQIPPHTEICFLDDQHHPLMEDERVFYINVKPYSFTVPFADLVTRYNIKFGNILDTEKVKQFTSRYRFTVTSKDPDEQRVDEIVSKQMLAYLHEFCAPKPAPAPAPAPTTTGGARKRKRQHRDD